jgi:hypothetical protein
MQAPVNGLPAPCAFCFAGRIALATPDVATIRDHFMDGFRCGTQEENSFLAAKFHAPAWIRLCAPIGLLMIECTAQKRRNKA